MLPLLRKEQAMERDLWAELSAAVSLVGQDFADNPGFDHPTSRIVRVHLWTGLHARPADQLGQPARRTGTGRPARRRCRTSRR